MSLSTVNSLSLLSLRLRCFRLMTAGSDPSMWLRPRSELSLTTAPCGAGSLAAVVACSSSSSDGVISELLASAASPFFISFSIKIA
ncbi:unnamed protein product [Microthlaspi erraticum]|uniref:Secreted protein n=1 Tax=Microthlaspi erraticum TaxID=1685480 RepID=A0A6D2IJG3_9BRAS|nr:unnamed protein product [Microthlaspi erraticum]CAA7028151.1 unnamed protein product [Microthlaspi erraticum]CAA7038111.1 unnamed protein product [Microthlaspi erraticum]